VSVLETARLRVRELTLDDDAFILRLLNDPAWLACIGDRGVRTLEAARDYLSNGPLKMYREHGFGLWLVETKTARVPAGICGLIKRPALDDVDLGYAFLPEFRGQGYAFEAGAAVLAHGRNAVALRRIVAICKPTNARSIALLTRLGFRFERTIAFPSGADASSLFAFGESAAVPAQT
jgi:RimJ/RimL family protein N-acetyltransferase